MGRTPNTTKAQLASESPTAGPIRTTKKVEDGLEWEVGGTLEWDSKFELEPAEVAGGEY